MFLLFLSKLLKNEKPLGMIINAKFVPLDDSDTELAMRLNPKKSSKGMV